MTLQLLRTFLPLLFSIQFIVSANEIDKLLLEAEAHYTEKRTFRAIKTYEEILVILASSKDKLLLGQLLYLEAEAIGIRSTGIGCFFDDSTHRVAGMQGHTFQDLYHFTLGGPVDDDRLVTPMPILERLEATISRL